MDIPYANYPGRPRLGVVTWYFVYAFAMAVLYLLCIGLGIAFLFITPSNPSDNLVIPGIAILIVSIPLTIMFGIAPFLPRKKWVWIYGIVLIAIGLTSICTMPA